MTTRVLIVRHGATVLTAEDRFASATDVALSELGERQAQQLSARLADQPIGAAYASPMGRTMKTASILASPHGIIVTPVEGLREINHGRWEEHTRAEVETKYADEYEAWEEDPFTFCPQGGESGLAVLARALPALREIVAANLGRTVLVVSHKATIRLLIGSLLGVDLRGYRDRFDQHPCCLNVLDFKDPGHARLMLFNDISHYEDQPKTPDASLSRWWDKATRT